MGGGAVPVASSPSGEGRLKELVKPETGHSLEAGKEPFCGEVGEEPKTSPQIMAAKDVRGGGKKHVTRN